MDNELPEKLKPFRARMHEVSDRRDLDRVCHCGAKLWYLGIKWATVATAGIVGHDADGEPIYGDHKMRAPYAYWRCINGHQETDGY